MPDTVNGNGDPLHAVITSVWPKPAIGAPQLVNLTVFCANGVGCGRQGVTLVEDTTTLKGDEFGFCHWPDDVAGIKDKDAPTVEVDDDEPDEEGHPVFDGDKPAEDEPTTALDEVGNE